MQEIGSLLKARVMANLHDSHHPPVTAYCIWNDKHGIKVPRHSHGAVLLD